MDKHEPYLVQFQHYLKTQYTYFISFYLRVIIEISCKVATATSGRQDKKLKISSFT